MRIYMNSGSWDSSSANGQPGAAGFGWDEAPGRMVIYFEAMVLSPMPDRVALERELRGLRELMQRTHPDKGGDAEAFDRARRRFDAVREELRALG